MSKNKKVMIIEHCDSTLQLLNESTTKNPGYTLSGKFTTFGQRNRNNRIYEAQDFLPHVQALQEKINNGKLLGEIEHPERTNTPLNLASHVVESLEYDKAQNCIVGKVRLLSTPNGMLARCLVNDGIPLHISSRAAGSVGNDGIVHLESLYTYDLVADPGFANAELALSESVKKEQVQMLNESYSKAAGKNVSEEYGFDANVVGLFELPDDTETNQQAVNIIADNIDTNINNIDKINTTTMDTPITDYVSSADFQKYTKYLSQIITNLSSAITNFKDEVDSLKNQTTSQGLDSVQAEAMIQAALQTDAEAIEEKYNNLVKYVNYIAEEYNKRDQHTDYLVEQMNNMIAHQDYMVDESNKRDKHNDYLVEQMNNMVAHQDHIVEEYSKDQKYIDYLSDSLNNAIAHQDYVVDESNKHNQHTEYLVEQMNNMVKHQDYIVEECNKAQKYVDYLSESLDNSISHQDYIVGETNSIESTASKTINGLSESIKNLNDICTTLVNENASLKQHQNYLAENITETPQVVSQSQPQAQPQVQTSVDDMCSKLDIILETALKSAKIAEAQKQASINESIKIVESKQQNILIDFMPESKKYVWESLSNKRKQEILNESKMYVINTVNDVVDFWSKRDLRERQVSSQTLNISESKESSLNPAMSEMAKAIKANLMYR